MDFLFFLPGFLSSKQNLFFKVSFLKNQNGFWWRFYWCRPQGSKHFLGRAFLYWRVRILFLKRLIFWSNLRILKLLIHSFLDLFHLKPMWQSLTPLRRLQQRINILMPQDGMPTSCPSKHLEENNSPRAR